VVECRSEHVSGAEIGAENRVSGSGAQSGRSPREGGAVSDGFGNSHERCADISLL